MIQKEQSQEQSQTQQEPQRYSDMSQEQLSQEIKEQEDFIATLRTSEYNIKEIEKAKQEITKQEQDITEKEQEFKESIRHNKERIKQAKINIKKTENYIKTQELFKEQQENLLRLVREIKEKLFINPNYYKEITSTQDKIRYDELSHKGITNLTEQEQKEIIEINKRLSKTKNREQGVKLLS